MRVGLTLKGNEAITRRDVVDALRAGIDGIKKRGNSDVGDKTLLDALVPAVEALEDSIGARNGADVEVREALGTVATVTRTAADATSTMQAMRGRASYTGERSIGSPDAGAVAMAVLAERLAEAWPAHVREG